jgi:hypothetical protein
MGNKQQEGPVCQSCGMPLAKDPKGGGSEADGRASPEYCSHCYRGGEFTMPELTVNEMVERVRARLNEVGLPQQLIDQLSGNIPALKRWRDAG